jgi:hypothetical protein
MCKLGSRASGWGVYLWEGAVVPEITLVWEAVADETKLSLLDVLLDWVEKFLLGDLKVLN